MVTITGSQNIEYRREIRVWLFVDMAFIEPDTQLNTSERTIIMMLDYHKLGVTHHRKFGYIKRLSIV